MDKDKIKVCKLYINLAKWLIGSVGLVIVSLCINAGFTDREISIKEMNQYDKYINLITDYNKVGQRKLLAEFFSNVMISEKSKKAWRDYYCIIKKEYKKTEEYRDSVNSSIKEKKQRMDNGSNTNNLSDSIGILIRKRDSLNNQLNADFNSNNSDYMLARKWEDLGFKYILERDLSDAITAFEQSERAYNTFHQVYEIGNYLKKRKLQLKEGEEIDWKSVYEKILNNYSWKMPENARDKLEKVVNESDD